MPIDKPLKKKYKYSTASSLADKVDRTTSFVNDSSMPMTESSLLADKPLVYKSQLTLRHPVQQFIMGRAEAIVDGIIADFASPSFTEVTDQTPVNSDFEKQSIIVRTLDHVPEGESTEYTPDYKTLFQLLTDSAEAEIELATNDNGLMNLHTLRTTTATTSSTNQYPIESLSSNLRIRSGASLQSKKNQIKSALLKMRKNHFYLP